MIREGVKREKVDQIFSTAIGYYKLDSELHDELKNSVRRAIAKVREGPSEWSKNMFHFYQHSNEHLLNDNKEDKVLAEFGRWIEKCYEDYVIDLCGWNVVKEASITDCWVNITKEGGQQVIHTHANAFVSGTYYLHMEDGAGPILFMNPTSQPGRPYIGFDTVKTTPYSSTQWYGDCQEGYLLLWPGNIAHLTAPTEQGATRTSISMNFMPAKLSAGAYNYRVVRDES